ncbi:hypothetical protein [Psittacicella hinzii]|uniref:hypothetical protein n=1 Tax=Psittacicella hinzii TaxID=2028575 RepID=UPI001CA7380F|nr:hypothetical protein [Psittacicella hinzii]
MHTLIYNAILCIFFILVALRIILAKAVWNPKRYFALIVCIALVGTFAWRMLGYFMQQ